MGLQRGLHMRDYTVDYVYGTTRWNTYTGLHGGLRIRDYTVDYIIRDYTMDHIRAYTMNYKYGTIRRTKYIRVYTVYYK